MSFDRLNASFIIDLDTEGVGGFMSSVYFRDSACGLRDHSPQQAGAVAHAAVYLGTSECAINNTGWARPRYGNELPRPQEVRPTLVVPVCVHQFGRERSPCIRLIYCPRGGGVPLGGVVRGLVNPLSGLVMK